MVKISSNLCDNAIRNTCMDCKPAAIIMQPSTEISVPKKQHDLFLSWIRDETVLNLPTLRIVEHRLAWRKDRAVEWRLAEGIGRWWVGIDWGGPVKDESAGYDEALTVVLRTHKMTDVISVIVYSKSMLLPPNTRKMILSLTLTRTLSSVVYSLY